jgi:hypothetical protein
VPFLKHVDPDSILVLVHRMGAGKHGQNAGLRHARQGRVFSPIFPEVRFQGRDIRYVISFNPEICTDFFKDSTDPIETVMHELWHIGTKGGGKLRRMRHGKRFNQIVKDLTQTYYRNGGAPAPRLPRNKKIVTRYWKNRQSPSIAYVRRGLLENLSRELAKINWQQDWDEEHLVEKNRILSSIIPKTFTYVCPNGHFHESHINFQTPRSCPECSSVFDRRFLLSSLPPTSYPLTPNP